MVTIENLKKYISSKQYLNLINAVNFSFNDLENIRSQILNIYSSLMIASNIEMVNFEKITTDKEQFISYYHAFKTYAEPIEADTYDEDDKKECEPYKSFLNPYITEFIALSKSKDLLIKHHKKNDPKGYKQHIEKLNQFLFK